MNPIGRPITKEEDSWIGSLMNIGAMLGTLPFGYIAEKLGRKPALLCIAIPHFVAYVSMAFAQNVYLFYFGRFLGGLAVGGGYTVLPMYIAEVAEDSKRGVYSVTLGIFWSIGNFLPNGIGPFLSIKVFNLILACIPVLFFLVFSLIGLETPYYLVAEKRVDRAEEVLMRLRSASKNDVQAELAKIQNNLRRERNGKLMDIFAKSNLRKAFIISLILISFQQLVGCNSIFFYMQPIIESSGSQMSSNLGSVLMGICYIVFSLFVPVVIERFGRKGLTIFSAAGLAVALFGLGTFFYIKDNKMETQSVSWLPMASLVLDIFMFQIGLNVTPWTISSELFPKNVKQISATAVSSMCWFVSFLITRYFNDMKNTLTNAGVFWFYGLMGVLCAIFTFIFVPETKGKSLGDIQDMLRRKTSFIIDTLDNDEKDVETNTK